MVWWSWWMAISQKVHPCQIFGTSDWIYLEKKDFACVIKDLEIRSSWIFQVDPKSKHKFRYKKKMGHRRGKKASWRWRQKWSWGAPFATSPKDERGKARLTPRAFRGSTALPTLWFWTPCHLNCERIHFYGLSHKAVIEITGNKCTWLLVICQQIWKTYQWPQDWKRSVFIPISKKGNAKECSNYHANAPISHASKKMLKILQTRLQKHVNWEFPDVQAEFRKGSQRNQRSDW